MIAIAIIVTISAKRTAMTPVCTPPINILLAVSVTNRV